MRHALVLGRSYHLFSWLYLFFLLSYRTYAQPTSVHAGGYATTPGVEYLYSRCLASPADELASVVVLDLDMAPMTRRPACVQYDRYQIYFISQISNNGPHSLTNELASYDHTIGRHVMSTLVDAHQLSYKHRLSSMYRTVNLFRKSSLP